MSDSNVNRCRFFRDADVGQLKVEVLCREVRIPGLELVPFPGDFAVLRRELGKVRRVFTTIDSRSARRSARNELPLEIVDASTTDLSEMVVFSEIQPMPDACLCCVYGHVREEDEGRRHVADLLGISLTEVRSRTIDARLAAILAAKHPGLRADESVGTSLDTLFRQLCGKGALLTPKGRQALAPLGLLSNLAGTLFCLELARRSATGAPPSTNYAALDPWRPLFRQTRLRKRRRIGCDFCGKAGLAALAHVWPTELHADAAQLVPKPKPMEIDCA